MKKKNKWILPALALLLVLAFLLIPTRSAEEPETEHTPGAFDALLKSPEPSPDPTPAPVGTPAQTPEPEIVYIEVTPEPTTPRTEDSRSAPEIVYVEVAPDPTPEPTEPPVFDYVLNTNTKRFHWPDCRSVQDIHPENYEEFTGTRDEVLAMGYVSCGNCKP